MKQLVSNHRAKGHVSQVHILHSDLDDWDDCSSVFILEEHWQLLLKDVCQGKANSTLLVNHTVTFIQGRTVRKAVLRQTTKSKVSQSHM